MDENSYLILLKGKDATSRVQSFEFFGNNIKVKFNNFKVYTYEKRNVFIENVTKIFEIDKQIVLHKDIVLNGVNKIIYFRTRAKVVFKRKAPMICDLTDITIVSNCLENVKAETIMKYWQDVAQYVKIDDDKSSFLEKELLGLTYIPQNSVLGYYLNKTPIKSTDCDLNNIIFPFSFNLSQKKALENALQANMSVIEGPPGTGKTQSILNIIANIIMQGKTVAVVSGNNAAVKNVYDKLSKEEYGFLVATLGSNKNRKLFFANLPIYAITDWQGSFDKNKLIEKVNKLNEKINKLLALNNEKSQVQQELSAYIVEYKHFNAYYEKQDIIKKLKIKFYKKTAEKIISFLAEYNLANVETLIDKWLFRLKVLFKYGFVSFNKLKDNPISAILNLQKEYYELKVNSLERQINKLEKELEKADFNQLLAEHKEYSTKLLRNNLFHKYNNLAQVNFTAKDYKSNFESFVKRFPIVLSTTHSLRNCISQGYLFDYLIIDESSQVDLLTGALALSCCKNAIIVGDTKQLPQIVDEKIEQKVKVAADDDIYDYFKHNILSSMLALYTEVPRVILREHYRCHPKIIEFCNQKYYNGELIPFTKEKETDVPFILYRTATGNHMRKITHGQEQGKFNQRELDVINEVLEHNNNLVTKEKEDIGVVTPYRIQANKAQFVLAQDLECDTVHKYQGREKKLMIMSTVLDSSSAGQTGIEFVDDPCKINVAVSRAQSQFVLITDDKLFTQAGKEISDLIRYIEYNSLDENIVQSEVVSVFDLLYHEYSDKLMKLKKQLPNKSEYLSENIMWQLLLNILAEDKYNLFAFTSQVLLKNLLKNTEKLTSEEVQYINNKASVDFVVYYKLNKKPALVIEVDGFAYHENNPKQKKRDNMKDTILTKYDLPLLRLKTTESGEEGRIRMELDKVMDLKYCISPSLV